MLASLDRFLNFGLGALLAVFLSLLVLGCSSGRSPVSPSPERPADAGKSPLFVPDEGPCYVENEVLVVLDESLPDRNPESVLGRLPLALERSIPSVRGQIYRLAITDGTSVEEMVARLKANPHVRIAQPDHVFQFAEAPYRPNDPKWESDDPGEDPRDSIYDQWCPAKIGADLVWNYGNGLEDVVVAVIDTGVRKDHEDLQDNIWVNEDEIPGNGEDDDENGYIDDTWGWDCKDNDNDPWDEGFLGHYHGTSCAGIIAAVQDNARGVSGVAPGVKIMALRVGFDEAWESSCVEAINYAVDNGADIVSMSFGGPEGGELLEQALADAWNDGQGISLIACAQNYNSSAPHYPGAYDPVMAVGATVPFDDWGCPMDEKRITLYEDGYNWGSNYGDWLTVMGFGDKYMTTSGDCVDCYHDGISQGFFQGTSAATPMAAGVMALIQSFHPGHTGTWYWNRLRDTADDLDEPGFDVQTGYGRCNAMRAVFGSERFEEFEDEYGFVPVNVALEQVFDSIHDVPGSAFYDSSDIYRVTTDAGGFVSITLDIYTWGEDLDLEVYSDQAMTDLIASSSGPNHYDSSTEWVGFNGLGPGEERFLRVLSPEEGNSTSYGLRFETVSNWLTVTGDSIAPVSVYQSDCELGFLKLELEVGYQATLDEIIVSKFGTAPNDSFLHAYLYRDSNHNEEFDDEDMLVRQVSYAYSNRVKFQNLGIYWTSSDPLVFFVAGKVIGAPSGSTIGLGLESYKDVSTEGGLEAHYADFPIRSDLIELSLDEEPPCWLTTVGAQSAEGGFGKATLAFNTAVDDLTPPVEYNVYFTDTLPFDIGNAEKVSNVQTEPGSETDLEAMIGGLEGGVEWHFVVRAQDQAGNEDENLETVSCTPQGGGDPQNPMVLNMFPGGGVSIAMHGDIIVTADEWQGVHIYRRLDPVNLEEIATYDEGQCYRRVAYDGEYAYVLTYDTLVILDMADPEHPQRVKSVLVEGDFICLNGDWAYIDGEEGHTLAALDISDPPNAPDPYRYLTPQGYHNQMAVKNNYLYLCHYEEGIMVFDVSNPGFPTPVNSFGDLGNMYGIHIEDDILYAFQHSGDLSTFDYSMSWTDPPLLDTNSESESCFAYGMVLIGDYAYVSEANYGIYVYDVSEPGNIDLVGDLEMPNAMEMVNDGSVIYVVTYNYVLVVV